MVTEGGIRYVLINGATQGGGLTEEMDEEHAEERDGDRIDEELDREGMDKGRLVR